MSKHVFFFILAFGFLASPARADILFLTFNLAPGEIRAVQQAADKRKEKLHVLPELSTAQKNRLNEIAKLKAGYLKQTEKTEDDAKIEELAKKLVELMEEEEAILNLVTVTPESLTAFLKKLNASGATLSTVILSGHDGNGKFWGGISEALTSEQIKKSFAEFPHLAESVRSVMLLGCYTTNIGSLDTYWKGLFPNVRAYAGYEQKGPLAHVAIGHDYIKAFLDRESQFAKARTKAEMLALFKKLPQIKHLFASIATSQFHVSHQGSKTIEELYASCRDLGGESPFRQKFNCAYQGENECAEVPKDTKAGPLRKFYEELQANAHCREMLTVDADHSLPKAEVVLSLIFFDNIRSNFLRNYRAELEQLDRWLAAAGQAPLTLATKARTRAELLADIRRARGALQTEFPAQEGLREVFLARVKAGQRLEEIDKILLTLVPACVPSEWVDPAIPTRSICLNVDANVEKSAEKAWEKAKGVTP